jgi:hypothetical protein
MKTRRLAVPFGAAVTLIVLCWLGIASASADAPTVIAYQGRLTDTSGEPIDATLPMTFALYASQHATTAAWLEAHPSITVADGLFTAYLGEIVPLSSAVLNDNAFLGLTVGSDSEMRPRQRLGAVPYARTVAPGAAVVGSEGPLVSITNTQSAMEPGNGVALDLRGTSGAGPVLRVALDSYIGPPAAFASAILAQRDSGIGAWPTMQSTNDSEWPGLSANSSDGTALVGVAGGPIDGGSPAGGPFSSWYGVVLPEVKAGVLGQSSLGPGGYFTSTHSEGAVAYGNPGIQGWSVAGAPGVAGHNDTASGPGVLGTSLNHSAVAGYAGIAGGQPGLGATLAKQRAGVAGASTIGPGGYFSATTTGLYATSIDGPAIQADLWISGMGAHGFNHAVVAGGGGVAGFAALLGSGWEGPGVLGRSKTGSAVVGEAGGFGSGPLNDPVGSLAYATRAGVIGYSSVGPGVFAWSTVTHSLVVSGNARITGDLLAGGDVITNADVAESFVAIGALEAGDVVVLDASMPLAVRRCDQPYDMAVAGIISTDPAILMPGAVDGVPLALVGRVPVKVDARDSAIQIGDLLTTSPTPGHAMRCDDRLQCIGAIVGKALEPLDHGRGVILTLVTLQ